MRLSHGTVRADGLCRARHDALDPPGLGQSASERARVPDSAFAREEGQSRQARPQERRGLLQVGRRQEGMITAFVASFLALSAAPETKWTAPALFVEGQPFMVHVDLAVGETVPEWKLD